MLIAVELEQPAELIIMSHNTLVMLNNTSWLWKAKAEQHG